MPKTSCNRLDKKSISPRCQTLKTRLRKSKAWEQTSSYSCKLVLMITLMHVLFRNIIKTRLFRGAPNCLRSTRPFQLFRQADALRSRRNLTMSHTGRIFIKACLGPASVHTHKFWCCGWVTTVSTSQLGRGWCALSASIPFPMFEINF